ncbi:unnamed protein product [Rhizophagus irregularis]|uniref:Uncharacterized protein n=1 Tax=Rhizophagus irregularis TaxID=588596 RepID=A0A915YSV2_9GLOM|nr:unnamed protein product [Rhizophagus irregularis]CAB5327667.1 unnamed protein product [Rhizophagus irregularis]
MMKTSQAYITNVRLDLCSSYAKGDVNIAESILKSNSLPNVDEDFQIERYNARIIARISDDQKSRLEIASILLKNSASAFQVDRGLIY